MTESSKKEAIARMVAAIRKVPDTIRRGDPNSLAATLYDACMGIEDVVDSPIPAKQPYSAPVVKPHGEAPYKPPMKGTFAEPFGEAKKDPIED